MSYSSQWWHECSTILRYMPGEDGKSTKDIISELDDVAECGFQAIHVTAPYRSAGFYPWWGLRPLDYFAANEVLGSMDDFTRLVEECHKRGLRVMIFLNIGYADITSPMWKSACLDRKYSLPRSYADFFLWSSSDKAPPPFAGDNCFFQGGHWHWSDDAQSYYWCFWERDGFAEPQFNWQNPDFQAYAVSVLKHWLNTGIDGVIVDAVNWCAGCTMPIIKRFVTDVIHSYPGVMCIPESATAFGDPYITWTFDAGFDVIEDQPFHSDGHWNGSAIIKAINSHDPNIIEEALDQRRRAQNIGIVSWSYITWDPQWTPQKRLLEVAMLIGTGHMTEILPAYLSCLDEYQKSRYKKLINTSRHPALAPIKMRLRIFPSSSAPCYACLCGPREYQKVICVFNLSEETSDVSISLADLPYSKDNAFCELISGKMLHSTDSRLDLKLEPYGFAYLTPQCC